MSLMLHGGEIYGREKILHDFSVNINPMGVPETVLRSLAGKKGASDGNSDRDQEGLRQMLERYPDQSCGRLRQALSGYTGLPAEQILCGNGASEMIEAALRAIRPLRILLTAPSFSGYRRAAGNCGAGILYHLLRREDGFALTDRFLEDIEKLGKTENRDSSACAASRNPLDEENGARAGQDMVILCSPSNPVGNLIDPSLLDRIARICARKGIWLMVDECFLGFAADEKNRTMRRYLADGSKTGRRLLVVDAFTKRFAMPGIRLGYLMASDMELLRRIHAQQPEWSVSGLAQAAGCAALENTDTYMEKARKLVASERGRMAAALRDMGFTVFPGEANYIFFSVDPVGSTSGAGDRADHEAKFSAWGEAEDAAAASFESSKDPAAAFPVTVEGHAKEQPGISENPAAVLLEKGILIRDCSNYPGLGKGYYRAAVKLPEENDVLLSALREWTSR